jgi:hypothetical protein
LVAVTDQMPPGDGAVFVLFGKTVQPDMRVHGSGLVTTKYFACGVPTKFKVKVPSPLFTIEDTALVWL